MNFLMPNKNEYIFVTKKKMPSGMTVQMTFTGEYDDQRVANFSVWLVVYKKRKQIGELVLRETGRDGLKTLIFAKEAIKAFEKYIVKKYGECHEKMYITIGWEDIRRRNVYYRGLKNDGYTFSHFKGGKVLIKQIQ